MRLFRCAVLLLLLGVGGLEVRAQGGRDGSESELLAAFADLIPLKLEEGRLAVDRAALEQSAAALDPEQLKRDKIARFMRRGMNEETATRIVESRRRSESAILNFLNAKFEVLGELMDVRGFSVSQSASRMKMSRNGPGFELSFEVELEPLLVKLSMQTRGGRSARLHAVAEGRLSLAVEREAEELFVLLRQRADGRLTTVYVSAEEPARALRSACFGELYDTERRFVLDALVPNLRAGGIGLPALRHEAAMVTVVLSALTPLGDDERRLGLEFIAALEHDDFERREDASAELASRVGRLGALIEESLAASPPPETRQRLAAVLASADPARARLLKLAQSGGLLSSPCYLISLFEELPARRRGPLVARLTELTGQSFGSDVEAWRRWLEESRR